MSNVIKIRSNGSAAVKVLNINSDNAQSAESEQEYLKKQIEQDRRKYFDEGREAAKIEYESYFESQLFEKYGEFENLVNSLNDKFFEYEKSFENIVVELSTLIAEKIVKKKIDEESIIKSVVKEASQKLNGAESIGVKINPDDYKLLKGASKELFNDETFSKVKFESDDKIEKGGCIIESEIGNVDARITTQLQEIKQTITKNLLNNQN
ncbi:MAG: hypothetical protein JW995_08010 [Melioribacteraceae bacterium]|nr:hypothetical protein [Melioribacteraceae bacterium]